jgi:hypothetical protein
MASKRSHARPIERGLGPDGGGWNIRQASLWSGIGEASLRRMAKRSIETGDPSLFPAYLIGSRRILIPRQGFRDWFNRRATEERRIDNGRTPDWFNKQTPESAVG